MNQGQTNKIECGGCKRLLDGFTSVDSEDAVPKDEDLSICAYCGTVGKYAEGVTKIKPLSEVEIAYIRLTDPEVIDQLEKLSREIKKQKMN